MRRKRRNHLLGFKAKVALAAIKGDKTLVELAILETDLAANCSEGFTPAVIDPLTGKTRVPASAKCCTSDITLAEFKTLKGKMDGANRNATTVEGYLQGTPG